jgi:hypothetical protein
LLESSELGLKLSTEGLTLVVAGFAEAGGGVARLGATVVLTDFLGATEPVDIEGLQSEMLSLTLTNASEKALLIEEAHVAEM